jgi:hypothetical protein
LFTDENDINLGNVWRMNVKKKPLPDRWVYRTVPIPHEVTEDRETLRLRFQSPNPTCAVYNIAIHTEPKYSIPVDHRQGDPFQWGPTGETVKPEKYE